MKFVRLGKEMWDISRMPPGLALHTVDKELKQDYIGTLRKIADIGYKLVEPIQYGGIPADELARALKRIGLGVVSVYTPPATGDSLKQQLEYARKIGARYVYTFFLEEKFSDEASLQDAIGILKAMAKETKSYGMQLLYHPHDYEYRKMGGRRIVDRLLEGVGTDLMILLIDTYWAKKGGADPLQTLIQYKGLSPIIHVKDMDKNGGFTEVGRGIIDWPPIFRILKEVGVRYYFVEQDVSKNPLESIAISLNYLKSIGAA